MLTSDTLVTYELNVLTYTLNVTTYQRKEAATSVCDCGVVCGVRERGYSGAAARAAKVKEGQLKHRRLSC